MKFPVIYLLHGRGGSPRGTMAEIQKVLELHNSGIVFVRPLLPHHDFKSPAMKSLEFLKGLRIPKNSLIVGKSLGGLSAAKLQEESRPDLHVICFCSPTVKENLKLNKKMPNRVSFFSSNDEVIADRVENWPQLAESHDLSWVTHADFDKHLDKVTKLIRGYINGENLSLIL